MQSRVWYAHTLVVPEKREPSTVNESAVAAAARLALQSTPASSHAFQRRRPRRFLELGLLATTAVLLLLVWRQYTGEPSISGDAVEVAARDLPEDAPSMMETGTVGQTFEPSPTEIVEEAKLPPVDATVQNLEEAEPVAAQPRGAGFAALNADLATGETYDAAADLPASEFARAPDAPGVEEVGELPPIHSGSEIEAIEVGEGDDQAGSGAVRSIARTPSNVVSNARSKPSAASGKSANQTKPKKTIRKQSTTQVSDFGDCSMPQWAWRVFGFTEEKRRRPC